MGNVEAKNILENTIDQSLVILNQTTQQCETPLIQSIGVNISGCSNVILSDFTLRQTGEFNIECATAASSTNEIESTISTQFTQASEAINQSLNLNPGSTSAENITSLMQKLSTSITSTYSQECIASTIQTQQVNVTNCTGPDGGTVRLERFNFEQISKGTATCTQETDAVSSIKSQVENIIDQSAKAELQNALGPILIIIVLVIIVIIIFYTQGASMIIYVVLFAVVIIGGYFGLAYLFSWWPFNESPTDSGEDGTDENGNGNGG